MKPNSVRKEVWVLLQMDATSYLILTIYDILYMSKSEWPLDELLDRFSDFISYKVRIGK